MRRLRLGVLGEFGLGNLGRDAALVAFMQWLKRHAAHVEPVALFGRGRANPDLGIGADALATAVNDRLANTGTVQRGQSSATLAGDRAASASGASRGGVRPAIASRLRYAIALLALWPQQLRCARNLAGVVVLGSGPEVSATRFTDTLRLWSWSLACRWAGKPFVLLSISTPPERSGLLARALLRATLRAAVYVSVADAESQPWVRAARRGRPVSIAPNPVFDLVFESRWESSVDPWQGRTQPMKAGAAVHTFGVSPARQESADPAAYDRSIGALARFCAATVRAGHRIVLFATCPASDRRAVLDLLARVPADVLFGVHVEEGTTVGDVARAVRGVRAVVATRVHGVLWGLWAARPVVSAGVDAHGATLVRSFDAPHQGAAAIVQHVAAQDGGALINALSAISGNYEERCERLTALLSRLRAAIDASYREAFARGGWEDAVSAPVAREDVAADGSIAAPGRV